MSKNEVPSWLTKSWDDDTITPYPEPTKVDTSQPRINCNGIDTNRIQPGDTVKVSGAIATVLSIDSVGVFEIRGKIGSQWETRWVSRPRISQHWGATA